MTSVMSAFRVDPSDISGCIRRGCENYFLKPLSRDVRRTVRFQVFSLVFLAMKLTRMFACFFCVSFPGCWQILLKKIGNVMENLAIKAASRVLFERAMKYKALIEHHHNRI